MTLEGNTTASSLIAIDSILYTCVAHRLVDERQVLDGVIDEFRIWEYARSDSEIASSWNRRYSFAIITLAQVSLHDIRQMW
jgi:hypothetical protein